MNAKSNENMKADQDRVRKLLSETVIMLCKSGLRFEDQLEIKGVIAITIDKNDVFIVHIDDKQTHGGIKSETSQSSPCTTSEIDQYSNQIPTKRIKVEDASSYQGYPIATNNTPTKNTNQVTLSLTSPHRVSAPQFFTDDIDNQTPLKNISSTQIVVTEPVKDPNQWALAIPTPKLQTPQTNCNNAMVLHAGGQPRMMMQPRHLMQQRHQMQPNMNPNMRPNMPGARMMMHNLHQQPQQIQQRLPMQRMPALPARPSSSNRGSRGGSGRGRARPVPKMSGGTSDMEMMSGKMAVDARNTDGFSYGKQTVTQYICNICGGVYKNHSSLLTHQVKSHGRQKKTGVGRRPKHMDESAYEEDDGAEDDGGYEYADDAYDEDYIPRC